MPQPEGDVPLANLVATSGGHTDPDQNAAPISKEEQATPTAAPGTRQLRHTRSQSARKAPAALGSTDAKANQAVEVSTGVDEEDVDILAMSSASSGEVDITGSPAVAVFAALHAALPLGHLQEGEEPEGATKQDQLVESQQESAVAAATEPDAAVHDTSAAMAGVDKDQPAASVKHSKSTEAVGPTAEPEESDITDNAPSGRGRGGRGRGRGARGRGKGRTKSKGRAKAAGNTSPKAPSEDQADFANELDSPSRNASDAAEQCIQLDPSREDVSISELSEGDHQQASQAAKGNSQLYKGKSDASQASGPHAGLKSQTSKADNLTVTQPDDLEMSELVEPKTSQLDESRASRREEPRTSGLEPPAKRPRRAAANANANSQRQKEPKEVNNGKAKEGTDGKAKQVNTGKAKARGAQARRGVVHRDIETIREVDEFSGEPAPSQDSGSSAGHDTSGALTPRAKSSLAKKLAKSLGFHSHKDSTRDATANKRAASEQHERQEPDDKQSPDRGVHFNSQTTSDRPASVTKSVVTLVASSGTSSGSTAADKQAFPGTGGNAKYVSPFQTAQHQPSGTLTDASAFYSPNSSFNSVASGRVPKALSASLDDDSSQMRKSRMAPGNPLSYSGDLEQLKPKPSMPDQPAGDERTASGMLSAKSRRSSAYSLKSMDDASDTEKDLSPLARANSENPWGPKRSVGSFTSGVSGRARGDASPRLRGAYAEIQIKDMDQQLSDARMRIVQLTAEVQSSKQKVQHHEENEAALQSQLDELKQVKDSPVKTVMEKLSSARSEASSLSEQLAAAKHDAEVQHKENLKLQKSLSEHSAAHQQAVDAVKKDLDSQKAASKAAKDQLQEQVAALTEQCNSYEVVLKNKDTKGQLMSLQQTLRQEIHAKIGAQSAEESAKRKVSELQGSMQELQEALDQETTAHRQAQSTLEEAYRHRNNLEARNDELEAELAASGGSAKPAETSTDTSAARGAADVGEHSLWQQLAQRLKEVEAREQAVHDLEETLKAGKQTELKDKEAKDKEAKEQQAMYFKVDELEKALTEANNRLTRIDEADKRFVSSPGSSPAAASSEVAAKAEAKPTPNSAAPAKQITSWRRISVDDDRVDAVISHLEGMNTTLKSLRSEGGDLEPYLGSDEDLASELEKERTGRIIAQQTANQEKLQARASAAESASLRRQLNELAQQMEQEKKAAAAKQQGQQAAETGMQQSHSFAEREIDRQGGFSPAFSGGLEGHAADKPSQQAFTRQSSGSPAWSVQDQQPAKVDEGIQATELEMQQGGQGVQQRSGSATPLSEEETGDSSKQEGQGLPSGQGMEKNYTDTIESLLSELWKERLARQRAELNATDAEDKLKAYVWAADPRNGEGVPGEGEQAKAMADLDASLMQRLDEDSATNHRLLDSLKAAQGNSQALQQRVEGLEVALRRQDSLVEKLQAGAKRHLEVSLRQGTTRKNLQQATQKEDKLRHQLTRTEAELAATRRLQRDQAAHFHASNKQVGDELVESQAQLSQQAGRLSKEGERRRHLEALLDEGLQVQNQILLGLQELVAYLKQEGHLEGHPGSGIMQAPNLDQLINLLQRSQANSSSALSRSSTRQGLGRQQSSPSRVRSAPSQRGNFGVSGTLEEGTPPVELSTSPPGTSTFSRPAWLVPGFRTEQRAAARKDGSKRSSSSFGATASRYMNPRASLKPDAEPDRVFRARSVPRGMSPQRSRVADYIKVGSPIQRGSSTQVLPATSSDLVSMDRELISAQHDRAFMFAPHQGAGNAEGLNRSKPGSLLSMDTGNAARDAGSFSSYDKLQGMASLPDNMHVQHANANGMAAWGQQTMDGFASALSVSTTSYGTRGRHTHDE